MQEYDTIVETIEECWGQEQDSRITSTCVRERFISYNSDSGVSVSKDIIPIILSYLLVWPHEVDPWIHSWYRGRVETLDAKYNLIFR